MSAVAAAFAASMIAMLANLTLGKRGYDHAQAASHQALRRSEAAIAELELLAALDIEAFECVMATWRMPLGNQCSERNESRSSQSRG